MKKSTLTKLIFLLAVVFSSSQSFSQLQRVAVYGYVINTNTGNPLPDQKIIIVGDTTEPGVVFADTVYSDGMGYFIDSVPATQGINSGYKVYTFDCQNNSLTYSFKGSSPENPYFFDLCASPNFNCHAEFTYFVSPQQPLRVHFDNHSFGSDFFKWDFDDGTSPSYSGDPVHNYASPGTYNVKLIIWDNWPFYNCSDTIIHIITLSFPEVDAHFEFTQNPYNPLEIKFQNQSNNNAQFYNWDFGDGTFSTEKNPFKKYNLPGNYDVKLTVFDELPVYHSKDSAVKIISQDSNLFYNLGGQVFDGLFPVNYGYAEIFRQEGQELVFEESTEVNETGVYYFYKKYFGNYLVRAHDVITGADPEFMPTYLGNRLFWQEAEAEMIATNTFSGDITLRQSIPIAAGQGQIKGYLKRNCQGGILLPAADVTIFLLDQSNQPYTVHYSDESGNFSFPNLAYGTYIVYPEITGKWSSPYTVVLDSLHPMLENLYFLVEMSSVAAVGELPPASGEQLQMTFYPNPCRDVAQLSVLSSRKQNSVISVTDLSGRCLIRNQINLNPGTNSWNLRLNDLKQGTYFVSVTIDSKLSVRKFTKLND